MARTLQVTFYPPHEQTALLNQFATDLERVFRSLGAEIIPFEQALFPGDSGKIKPGIVVIEQGEGKEDELAVHRLTSLYRNTVVGVYDRSCPVNNASPTQEKLDTVVEVMAWNMIHIPIFVDESSWTVCTMTGSIIRKSHNGFREGVARMLIPKLTATVVPPDRSRITYRVGALDTEKEGLEDCVEDFMYSAQVWKQNGLMLAHTSLEDVAYRNRFFRRIVSAFLDERTGMSYGFMVRQLPTAVKAAIRLSEAGKDLQRVNWEDDLVHYVHGVPHVRVRLGGEDWIVELPDMWVLSTRSGCEKTNIDPSRDLVRMGLERGSIVFETPDGVTAADAQPSYDTHAILSHAAGNAIVASISRALGQNDEYVRRLHEDGFSITHWHGYPPDGVTPQGYVLHGPANPPVSCSTPQSAVYSLTGKLKAFEQSFESGEEYRGDMHVEPYHGTNITGVMHLYETARWVDAHCAEPLEQE